MAIPDTTPLTEQNGALELLQSGFYTEAENAGGGQNTVSNTDYSGGEGKDATDPTDDVSDSFTVDYTIPAADVGFAVRLDSVDGSHAAFDLNVGGEPIQSVTSNSISSGLKWFGRALSGRSSDLTAGTYTAEIDITGTSTSSIEFDALFVFDDRQSYTFDNTVDSNNGHLDGPELFPEQIKYDLATETLDQPATEATVSQTWNDTAGSQYVEIDLGGETTRNQNSASATVSVARSNAKEQANARVSLSRFGSRSSTSPKTGFKGQSIDDHTITVDPVAVIKRGIGRARTRMITPDGDLSSHSDDLNEAGQLDTNDNLLTRGIYSSFSIPSSMAVISNEVVEFTR
jgi:hypothetical protein